MAQAAINLAHQLQLQLLPDHCRTLTLTDVLRQSLSVAGVYRESLAVLLSAPRTFALITLSLVFPLSLTVLFSHPTPLFLRLTDTLFLRLTGTAEPTQLSDHFLFDHLFSLLLLFTFSLLSTAAVVYTVASLYASKPRPVSFTSTLSALPSLLPRLFLPFLVTFLLLLDPIRILLYFLTDVLSYHPALLLPMALLLLSTLPCILFLFALSSVANPASVLEPLRGHAFATVVRSLDLIRCRTSMSATLATVYLTGFHTVVFAFKEVVVKGFADEDVTGVGMVLLGGALLTLLPVVILYGLIVQTVQYFVCRSSIQMNALVAGVRVVALPGDA